MYRFFHRRFGARQSKGNCVELDDRFYSLGGHVVCISESDAEKLGELSGIEITGKKVNKTEIKKTIFVPFNQLLILDEWEKYFKNCVKGTNQEREQKSAPSSFSTDHRTFYEIILPGCLLFPSIYGI